MASCQSFLGHFKYPLCIVFQEDLRFLYTIGDGNGIFKWSFYGDKEAPIELNKYFEEIVDKKN